MQIGKEKENNHCVITWGGASGKLNDKHLSLIYQTLFYTTVQRNFDLKLREFR